MSLFTSPQLLIIVVNYLTKKKTCVRAFVKLVLVMLSNIKFRSFTGVCNSIFPQGREEQVRVHKCYKAMRHSSGEVVSVRDCVILQSDGDGSVPYVARVTCLWENLHGMFLVYEVSLTHCFIYCCLVYTLISFIFSWQANYWELEDSCSLYILCILQIYI